MGKEAKTNAMRMLDRKKVKYEAITYDCGEFIDGIHCAERLMTSLLKHWSWKERAAAIMYLWYRLRKK